MKYFDEYVYLIPIRIIIILTWLQIIIYLYVLREIISIHNRISIIGQMPRWKEKHFLSIDTSIISSFSIRFLCDTAILHHLVDNYSHERVFHFDRLRVLLQLGHRFQGFVASVIHRYERWCEKSWVSRQPRNRRTSNASMGNEQVSTYAYLVEKRAIRSEAPRESKA